MIVLRGCIENDPREIYAYRGTLIENQPTSSTRNSRDVSSFYRDGLIGVRIRGFREMEPYPVRALHFSLI